MPRTLWSDIVSWETDYSTFLQRINSMHWWPSFQRRNEISWRIVISMVSNCSEMLNFDRYWKTYLILHGRWITKWTKLLSNVSVVWSLAFIIRVNSNSIAMFRHCQTMQSGTVSWLCSQEILSAQKSTSGGTLCVFGSHTFVLRCWMCEKQTSVSHSSTQSEIIFGRRIEIGRCSRSRFIGSDCLCLWSPTQNHDRTVQPVVSRYCG